MKTLLAVRIPTCNKERKLVVANVDLDTDSYEATKKKLAKFALDLMCKINNINTNTFEYRLALKSLNKQIIEYSIPKTFKNDEIIEIEPSKKKKKKTISFNRRMSNFSLKKIQAKEYKTNIEELEKFKLYVYKDESGRWCIAEAITGSIVVCSKFKKDLEEYLLDLKKRLNLVEVMQESIKEAISKFENANPHLVSLDRDYTKEESEKATSKSDSMSANANTNIVVNELKENPKAYNCENGDRIEEINKLLRQLVKITGIKFNSKVTINNRLSNTLGRVVSRMGTDGKLHCLRMEISDKFLKVATKEELRKVVAHEYAHYCCNTVIGRHTHNTVEFKNYCKILNTSHKPSMSFDKNKKAYKYTIYCSCCGRVVATRNSSNSKIIRVNGKNYVSSCCKSDLKIEQNY